MSASLKRLDRLALQGIGAFLAGADLKRVEISTPVTHRCIDAFGLLAANTQVPEPSDTHLHIRCWRARSLSLLATRATLGRPLPAMLLPHRRQKHSLADVNAFMLCYKARTDALVATPALPQNVLRAGTPICKSLDSPASSTTVRQNCSGPSRLDGST